MQRCREDSLPHLGVLCDLLDRAVALDALDHVEDADECGQGDDGRVGVRLHRIQTAGRKPVGGQAELGYVLGERHDDLDIRLVRKLLRLTIELVLCLGLCLRQIETATDHGRRSQSARGRR